MPVLSLEPQVFPDNLFEPTADASVGRCWWALHTRPRQEKSLARQLHAGGVPFYLPLVSRRLKVRNRAMTSYVPLFPGYLFLLAGAEERIKALSTQRIVRSIPVVEQDKFYSDLLQTHRLITCGAPITPEGRLLPGTQVEIRTGPLAGLRGKILQSASGRRFVVEVDFIQKGASVLLEDFTLTPVIA
jgi:transcription antitermination factor NusG